MIQTNILEYLEKTVKEVPDKTAYTGIPVRSEVICPVKAFTGNRS